MIFSVPDWPKVERMFERAWTKTLVWGRTGSEGGRREEKKREGEVSFSFSVHRVEKGGGEKIAKLWWDFRHPVGRNFCFQMLQMLLHLAVLFPK